MKKFIVNICSPLQQVAKECGSPVRACQDVVSGSKGELSSDWSWKHYI